MLTERDEVCSSTQTLPVAMLLDARAKPPQAIKDEFKRQQKAMIVPGNASPATSDHKDGIAGPHADSAYHVKSVPGLIVYPSLLSSEDQLHLLDRLFNRDLIDPQHKTNVHMHYHVPYPAEGQSFFDSINEDLVIAPKEPELHKPITTRQFLEKKLRWMTLGGQYDWTNKVYPAGRPPPFPEDIKRIIENAFPMKAEAAIVNLYSPGDTLSLHRDVSEECNKPLASVSVGCDCIFVVGIGDEHGSNTRMATLVLRSGDAVLMSGESRYAWHGVPKVIPGTCPAWLEDWPGDRYKDWKGWMSRKRINLNVRQMFGD